MTTQAPNPIHAFIFDMDGTIIDSEEFWTDSDLPYLQSLAPELTTEDYEHVITGRAIQDIYDIMCDKFDIDVEWEDFAQAYDDIAYTIFTEQANPIAGAFELIAELVELQVPIGLASSANRSWIDIVLHRFGLEQLFDYTVSAQDIDGPGKPAPDIYLHAANQLGVSPEHCVVIEDSEAGLTAAVEAGMYCIGIRNGHNESVNMERVHTIMRGYAEFPRELLDQLA